MLLDRFGQSNKFWKKSYKKYWNIQVWVLWRSSKGRSENVLGTSRINLLRTSLECQIRTYPGHHFRTSPGHYIRTFPGYQIGMSPRRSNRIFRVRPGDIGEECPQNVLGTNICRLDYKCRFSWISYYSKNKDLNMAQCDSCQNWYHRKYENVISLRWHFA